MALPVAQEQQGRTHLQADISSCPRPQGRAERLRLGQPRLSYAVTLLLAGSVGRALAAGPCPAASRRELPSLLAPGEAQPLQCLGGRQQSESLLPNCAIMEAINPVIQLDTGKYCLRECQLEMEETNKKLSVLC